MQQIYLCRHGETEWSLSGQHTGRTDLPLTERGKAQTLLLRKRLQGVPFEAVFTSPLKRAMESCEGLHAVEEPLAMEWDYGDYEGMTTKQIEQKNPQWDLFTEGAPHGESPEEIGARADQFLKKIGRYTGNVALFSHGHFLRVLAARFLGLEPKEARILVLSVASVSILGWERKQPVIALWNDVDHLRISSRDGDDRMRARG